MKIEKLKIIENNNKTLKAFQLIKINNDFYQLYCSLEDIVYPNGANNSLCVKKLVNNYWITYKDNKSLYIPILNLQKNEKLKIIELKKIFNEFINYLQKEIKNGNNFNK